MTSTTIYKLKLYEQNFYVGKTSRPLNSRRNEHRTKSFEQWSKYYFDNRHQIQIAPIVVIYEKYVDIDIFPITNLLEDFCICYFQNQRGSVIKNINRALSPQLRSVSNRVDRLECIRQLEKDGDIKFAPTFNFSKMSSSYES